MSETYAPQGEQETALAPSPSRRHGSAPCAADEETEAVFEEILKTQRFLENAQRDIAMLQVTAREMEEMVNNADDYRDEYFSVQNFTSKVAEVWQDRKNEDATSTSPKRTVRLFPNQSSILAQQELRERQQRAKALAADAEALEQRHPLMYRRIARDEERRKAFNEALAARNESRNGPSGLLALTAGNGDTSETASGAAMGATSGVPAHLTVSADGTQELARTVDASAILGSGPGVAPVNVASRSAILHVTPAASRSGGSAAAPPSAGSGGRRQQAFAGYRQPNVENAARLMQQQALERKAAAAREMAIAEFGEDPSEAANPTSAEPQTQPRGAAAPSRAAAAPDTTASPSAARNPLDQLIAEQSEAMASQERRHQEEYKPMLEKYFLYHEMAQEKLSRIADMAGFKESTTPGMGSRRPPPPSEDIEHSASP